MEFVVDVSELQMNEIAIFFRRSRNLCIFIEISRGANQLSEISCNAMYKYIKNNFIID